ncbi:MAG TPA: MGMT family protein [Pyrinomonadaceae bacterium]|jgi:methylated-DNA-protein-cysteine methyltransferase-like protein
MAGNTDNDYRERVFRIVRSIPRGRVMTYGQIAEILGEGYTPRTVGFVMHSSNDKTPWHRVVNAQGGCSTRGLVLPHDKQQRMLEAEGISFNERGRCDLQKYLWIPAETKGKRKTRAEKASLFKN